MDPTLPAFSGLSPGLALSAVEEAFGIEPEGSFFAYPSYVNRVYGFRASDPRFPDREAAEYVVKFYRPGRWTVAAVREEHAFLAELAAAEVPVVAPLADEGGETLAELVLERPEGEISMQFALFPKRGGRSFDTDGPDAFARMGALIGRIHAVGRRSAARHRARLGQGSMEAYAEELERSGAVHADAAPGFFAALSEAGSLVDAAFRSVGARAIRLHGDFHRGNVLDRQDQGLWAIDFDDMSAGPAVQDLWLLLPAHLEDSRAELEAAIAGYEAFMPFDRAELALVEPLRLLRMVHFLAWQARQRHDEGFFTHFPAWGTRGFWQQETEDLRTQMELIGP